MVMKAKKKKQVTQKEPEDPHHRLFEAISALKDAEEAKLFLLDLCTPAELQVMADRWSVVDPINKGVPYRKIYEDTGVSVTTIGRVARFISHGNGGYNLIYERLKKKRHVTRAIKNSNTKKGEVK